MTLYKFQNTLADSDNITAGVRHLDTPDKDDDLEVLEVPPPSGNNDDEIEIVDVEKTPSVASTPTPRQAVS